MDVNSINNNISSLNSLPQQNQLGKTSSKQKIEEVSNEALSLSISESYNKKRDELSESLQKFNEGIAVSRIAQNGLDKQKEILTNIKDKIDNSQNLDDKNILKEEINQDLTNFTQEAINTKYQRNSLLITDPNAEENSISIETKEATFTINKINTPIIANELSKNINELDLNNEENLNTIGENIETSSNHLNELSNQFSQISKTIEEKAKETLTTQFELVRNNQTNNINFGKEATDFTKSNVSANVGYLAVSQANIVQEQSVRLLS